MTSLGLISHQERCIGAPVVGKYFCERVSDLEITLLPPSTGVAGEQGDIPHRIVDPGLDNRRSARGFVQRSQRGHLRLFEVAGADVGFRPSPYCWRIRMALAHKGLAFEAVPWRAVEKDRIARSGGGTVPVLVDGELWLRESWDIAVYLDRTYPDRPLFGGEGDRAKACFLDHWITDSVQPVIARAVLMDQFPLLDDRDKAYYLERTRRKFSCSLEDLCSDPDGAVKALGPLLEPLQKALTAESYLGGAHPSYGDYIAFGALQWARVASSRRLVAPESAIGSWFARLLSAFDGFAAAQADRSHWPQASAAPTGGST